MTKAQKTLLNKIARYQKANFKLWNHGSATIGAYSEYGTVENKNGNKCITKAAQVSGMVGAWLEMLNEGMI
jgi:hypothetical protein